MKHQGKIPKITPKVLREKTYKRVIKSSPKPRHEEKLLKWISIRKQKPPLDTEVLVFQKFPYGTDIKIAEFVRPFNKKRPVFGIGIERDENGYVYDGFPLERVTHWMPLPEPPKFRS